ncbi:hypothetical protein IW262DRAFT_1292293 [Armillaria fumosa]|nr:hypothetical protein IW262DRAFT_1292293 [Armillaria fumosa]
MSFRSLLLLFVWSESENRTLINVLLEEKKAGNQSDNGWKKIMWNKARLPLMWFGNHANAEMKWFKTHLFPLYNSMSKLVDGTVATGTGAFHAGQEPNIDVSTLAIPQPSHSPVLSPSHPVLCTPPHSHLETEMSCQALQEKTNVLKDSFYDDELSYEHSDSEQIPFKSTSHKHESMAPLENPVAKALELIHDNRDFSNLNSKAGILTLFTIKPEIATALLQSCKQGVCTALIKMMLQKENL